MRSLAKPPKMTPSTSQQKKEQPGKKDPKQSRKVLKTMFHSPFRYKIQSLSLQDGDRVIDLLINFAKVTRGQLMIPERKVIKQKVIRFDSKVAYDKPPIVCQHLSFGIKQCVELAKKPESCLTLIFYDENLHDKFEELMCNLLYHKKGYIVLRQEKRLTDELGLKKVLALAVRNQELEGQLLKYGSRCLIEIPWLVDPSWIPLEKTQKTPGKAQKKSQKKKNVQVKGQVPGEKAENPQK